MRTSDKLYPETIDELLDECPSIEPRSRFSEMFGSIDRAAESIDEILGRCHEDPSECGSIPCPLGDVCGDVRDIEYSYGQVECDESREERTRRIALWLEERSG